MLLAGHILNSQNRERWNNQIEREMMKQKYNNNNKALRAINFLKGVIEKERTMMIVFIIFNKKEEEEDNKKANEMKNNNYRDFNFLSKLFFLKESFLSFI